MQTWRVDVTMCTRGMKAWDHVCPNWVPYGIIKWIISSLIISLFLILLMGLNI